MQRISTENQSPKITRAERVWLQLAAEIVNGGVPGGRRLDEVEQASRLGVSRTPLRESLRQLAALGLVENRPHRGVVVADDAGDSLFAVLSELEAVCAAGAAARLPRLGREMLLAAKGCDAEILPLIRKGCGNAVLKGLLETLWQPLVMGGVQGNADHSALVSRLALAVADGDESAAAAAARAYVAAWKTVILGGAD